MKRFTLTFAILCALCALAYTGTERYSGKEKEMLQPVAPAGEWYRTDEWDLMIWGAYAFPANDGHHDPFIIGPCDPAVGPGDCQNANNFDEHENQIDADIGPVREDRFLNRGGAWGGGADLKYFFTKYLALGVEGFILDANDNIGGAGLGTFTFRFPIGDSRFAPYAFVGAGAVGGGSHTVQLFSDIHTATEESGGDEEDVEFLGPEQTTPNRRTLFIGQFGGGMEIRITRPSDASKIAVGVMADFTWNAIQEGNNDFGMGRFGVSLSY